MQAISEQSFLAQQGVVLKDMLLNAPGFQSAIVWSPVADVFLLHLLSLLQAWLPRVTRSGHDHERNDADSHAITTGSPVDAVYTIVQHIQYVLQYVLAVGDSYGGSTEVLERCCKLVVRVLEAPVHDHCAQVAGMVLAGGLVVHAETTGSRLGLKMATLASCAAESAAVPEEYSGWLPHSYHPDDTVSHRSWLCLFRGMLMFSSRLSSKFLWDTTSGPAIVLTRMCDFISQSCTASATPSLRSTALHSLTLLLSCVSDRLDNDTEPSGAREATLVGDGHLISRAISIVFGTWEDPVGRIRHQVSQPSRDAVQSPRHDGPLSTMRC